MDFARRMTRHPIPHDAGAGAEAARPFADLGPQIGVLLGGAAGCSPYLRDLMRREEAWLREALARSPEEDLADLLAEASSIEVGSSRVDLQACKLEYSIVSPK